MTFNVFHNAPRAAWVGCVFFLSGAISLAMGASATKRSTNPNQKATQNASLDFSSIHQAYNDGDFEKVLAALEPFLASKTPVSRQDSLFVFKHLGVIYSKDAATREKGKYCFRKVFDVDPNAQILDMYATDEIYSIFRTVRDEWLISHPEFDSPQSTSPRVSLIHRESETLSPAQPSGNSAPRKPSGAWKIWTVAGGAAVVTASVATWYLLAEPETKTKTTFVVDSKQPGNP